MPKMGILGKRDMAEGEEASIDGFEGQMAVPVWVLVPGPRVTWK